MLLLMAFVGTVYFQYRLVLFSNRNPFFLRITTFFQTITLLALRCTVCCDAKSCYSDHHYYCRGSPKLIVHAF